ncbi:MAG: glycosyltransferase [Planctomycetota bacterium]
MASCAEERTTVAQDTSAPGLAAARDRPTQPSLLVFSDDWGRHPSSCQHLIRQLLPKYRVCWVNTIGMRPPRLDVYTIRRGAEKLRIWFRSRQQPGDSNNGNLTVHNPRMWPWIARRHDRWLNRHLLELQLRPVLDAAASPVVAITTVPNVADLIDRLPVARWVYYCVDDFSNWKGMDAAAIKSMESQLVQRADVIVAASPKLQESLRKRGRDALLLTHGVDLEHWEVARSALVASQPVAELEGLESPLVLFWGSINWQLDVEFLRRLSAEMPSGTIALVGPKSDVDPRVFDLPRLVWIPPVPYDRLPQLAAKADVLVMPYLNGPGLDESQPLKLKEYLAAGKPAVVRDLPANRVWSEALDLVRTPGEFSERVRERLLEGLPASQANARRPLANESWADKARQFERFAIIGRTASDNKEHCDVA